MLGRYLVAAVNGALATAWPAGAVPARRRGAVEALRWAGVVGDVIAATGGTLHRDHLYHADHRWPFLAHLALPEAAYRVTAGHPLGYRNRLTPTQVAALFRAAGFDLVALRRLILPEHRWGEADEALRGAPGLPRRLLAPRFRDISEIDLRTAAAHYLCRAI
jgi:hypothetical protein